MSRILTGDKLISSVRKRAMIPSDDSAFNDQDILDVINEEMDVQLLDKLTSLHEEHLTITVDIPKNDDNVYDIPHRSVGNKVRDISLLIGDTVYELAQIGISELSDYLPNASAGYNLDKFYVENNQLKLISGTLNYTAVRVHYTLRPSVVVKEAAAAKVISFTQNSNILTVSLDKVPNNFTQITYPQTLFDIVAYQTPNKIKYMDLPVQFDLATRTATVTLPTDKAVDLKIGDWLCRAEESPVPNIPTEMHPVLAQLAAVHILEATGDTESLNNAKNRLQTMMNSVTELIDDRVDLAPRKIRPRNGVLSDAISNIGVYRRRGRR